jgi:4-diphosphocytidyl-2-C-methyl-D-erythritol kinase
MLSLLSPAKVNIFLRVVGRFPDGRPDTVALSQAVDICDTLHFAIADEDRIECNEPSLYSDYVGIIKQAVDLFRLKSGISFRVAIKLDKTLPAKAGLFGKSSNAATTLWGINQLLSSPVTVTELKAWSKEISQEAAFFFTSGTTLNRGHYEEEAWVGMLPTKPILIAIPSQELPPKAVYKRLRMDELEFRDIEQIIQKMIEGKLVHFNDLEDSAFAIYPKLALIKERLIQSGFPDVTMTGSGPSLVCYGNGHPPEMQEDVRFFKAQAVNRSKNAWY